MTQPVKPVLVSDTTRLGRAASPLRETGLASLAVSPGLPLWSRMADGALLATVREVFDNVPVGVVVIRVDGVRVYANPEALAMFGYDYDHIDRWWPDAYPDSEDRADAQRRWQRQLERAHTNQAGVIEPEVYHIRCADGSYKWVEVFGVGLKDLAFVAMRDITESRRQQAALRAESGFRDAIINAAADGICVCHAIEQPPHIRFTVWSERMTEMTGYTMDEINQFGWHQSVYRDPEVRERAIGRMDRMRHGENLRAEEWPIVRKDGSPAVLAISTSVILAEDGESHVLALMQDRTEQHRVAEAQRRLEAQMQHAQKLESLGLLAGGIAHDFNNLLVAVMGQADLALEDLEPASTARERLLEIKYAAERAAELTNQMLAYAGKASFVIGPVDLNDLIREMANLLGGSAARHVEVRLQLCGALPVVQGDVSQLRQVVLNLMTNAAEAMESRPGTLKITSSVESIDDDTARALEPLGTARGGRYVRLTFEDTGVGMDETTRHRMFEPFYSTKFSGRGLGLAAVLGIIAGHKGGLHVTSEIGEGTRIDVLLPASGDDAQRAAPRADSTPSSRGTILLVDDDAQVRGVARAILTRNGYRVVEASSGPEGLARFDAERFVAVVLDVTMPVVDGRTVLRELRLRRPHVPVVLISGYAEEAVADDLNARTRFLQKPFARAELTQTLDAVIDGRTSVRPS